MNEELQNQLDVMIGKMPAFPASVQRVIELTADISCSPKELVQVIEHDPVMTVKLLKLLNSAYYSLPRQITSVKRSVVYVGLNTVKNMALSIATLGMLPKKNIAGFDTEYYLQHSIATAAIAKMLNSRFGHEEFEASDCFVAGLLHDIGKVVYAQFNPSEFESSQNTSEEESIALYKAERKVIGVDHSVVGSLLGDKWQFPESLVACIGDHHDVDRPGNQMRDCVIAANQLSKIVAPGQVVIDSHNLPDTVANRFGMDLTDLHDYLGDVSNELSAANAYMLATG